MSVSNISDTILRVISSSSLFAERDPTPETFFYVEEKPVTCMVSMKLKVRNKHPAYTWVTGDDGHFLSVISIRFNQVVFPILLDKVRSITPFIARFIGELFLEIYQSTVESGRTENQCRSRFTLQLRTISQSINQMTNQSISLSINQWSKLSVNRTNRTTPFREHRVHAVVPFQQLTDVEFVVVISNVRLMEHERVIMVNLRRSTHHTASS